jgi:hypothetical protein
LPDGVTHYKYFKKGYLAEIPLTLLLIAYDWKLALGNIVGYSLGRWIDPDWDIMGTNNAEGRMVNEIPIMGHFLYGVSSAYGSFWRKAHRSFWTHFPFISTAIRLIYVFLVPFILFDYYKINLIGNGWHMFHVGVWIGLSQADGIHYFLDKTYGD